MKKSLVFDSPMKKYRMKRKMSLTEMAYEIGMDRSSYYKAECGQVAPRRDTIAHLILYYKGVDARIGAEEILFPFGMD